MTTISKKDDANPRRREFLSACGKFAVVTPPVLSLMLSTASNAAYAQTSSGNNGGDPKRHGRHGGDGGRRHHRHHRHHGRRDDD